MPAQGYRFNRSMQRCERSGKGGLPRGSPLQEGRRCASPRERPLTARLTDRFGSATAGRVLRKSELPASRKSAKNQKKAPTKVGAGRKGSI
ncbi:hypothetical protein D3C87_1819550 [compost metagenome]